VQRTIRHSALPLRGGDQEFIGAILIDEDVTQLKEAEEALRQAVQTREDVLAIVAHDLRNPLSGILLQAQVLGRAAQDARTREGIESIRRPASRMNRLIQDLLDVTRIEQGALAIHRGRVRAHELLADVLHTQEPIADKASIELHLDLREDVPDVWADRERIMQVLENLIGNALKFTPAGGRVIVGAGARAHDTLFWVADSGPGVPAEDLAHIFDRFWQASRKDRRGTGLGLAIVRGIVERHGGRVWAESKPSQGATFFFTMPRADQAGDWSAAPAAR